MTTVDFDSKDSKWTLVDDEDVRSTRPASGRNVKLGEDEELNATKLNELKTALDDLKIVDVVRKPAGLSADLRAGEDVSKNRETALALQRRGFFLVPDSGEYVRDLFQRRRSPLRHGRRRGVYPPLWRHRRQQHDDEEDAKDKGDEKKADEAGAEIQGRQPTGRKGVEPLHHGHHPLPPGIDPQARSATPPRSPRDPGRGASNRRSRDEAWRGKAGRRHPSGR